jgi:acetyl esterase
MQALLYPCLDTAVDTPAYEDNKDPFVSREGMRFYWDKYLEGRVDTQDPVAVPMRARDLSGLAPAYVLTAEHDPLGVEGEAYAARLREAGVRTTLDRVPGTIHGLLRARFASARCQEAMDRLAGALRAALA